MILGRYEDVVTGQQLQNAPQFRGGLLIDAPGLGKTLSIIALLAHQKELLGKGANMSSERQTTLLVVPKTRESTRIPSSTLR